MVEQEVQTILENLVNEIGKKSRRVSFSEKVRYSVIPSKEYLLGTCNVDELWWKPHHYAMSRQILGHEYMEFMQTYRLTDPKRCKSIFWYYYTLDE